MPHLAGSVLVCLALYLFRAWPTLWSTVDDAWISARYASQAAAGNGLVFNAGEPAVEGFTNLLWTVGLVVPHLLGWPMATVLPLVGLFCGCASIVLAMCTVYSVVPRGPSALGVGLVLASSVQLAVSSTNGLETSLFVASCIAATWATLRQPRSWRTGFALALLPLIRPEGLVLSTLLALSIASRRHLSPVFVPLASSCAAVTCWRWVTYGAWLPNTFAAKANGSWWHHLETNTRYLTPDLLLLIAPVVTLLFTPFIDRDRGDACTRWAVALAVLVMTSLALRVDLWMPGTRLLAPSIALSAVLAFTSKSNLLRAVWCITYLIAPLTWLDEAHYDYDRAHTVQLPNGTSVAMEQIVPTLPDGAWVATRDAGLLAYLATPRLLVAETHERALTQPHPSGRAAALEGLGPRNPHLIVLTQSGAEQRGIRYPRGKQLTQRLDQPYRYLGRVRQHHRRHYDLYLRGASSTISLPTPVVVNRRGPDLSNTPAP